MKNLIHNQNGYIALIAVLIITVVTLAISISLNLLSIGEAEMGLLQEQSVQAFSIADSCIQEAYAQLKNDSTYTGASLNVGGGSCTITVTGSGQDRTVTAASDAYGIKRKIQTTIRLTGKKVTQQTWVEMDS